MGSNTYIICSQMWFIASLFLSGITQKVCVILGFLWLIGFAIIGWDELKEWRKQKWQEEKDSTLE